MMKDIWIIGGGRFGLNAALKLYQKNVPARITVIEQDPYRCRSLSALPFETICAEGVEYLIQRALQPDSNGWVIPAIPKHFACEWLKRKSTLDFQLHHIPVPQEIFDRLPHALNGPENAVFSSYADFICPDNCPEPKNYCMVTREERRSPLYRLIAAEGSRHMKTIVVRSHQLLPGVGGYSIFYLNKMLARIRLHFSQPVLVATACACHGVIHALRGTNRTY
jgi:hypothetical protein